ncbi:MAG: DNA-processing protein DprA [Caldilineaceae bacterium]
MLVSDYPLGTRPEPRNFPPRNRIISGLSTCVVIVEAGTRSGALITAEFAADQGREVFAVPGSILHPGSVGCNRLIQDGATPLLSIDDLLAQLDLDRKRELAEVRRTMPSDPLEARVLERLNMIPQHVDDLARRSGAQSRRIDRRTHHVGVEGLVRHGFMSYVQA